MSLNDGYAGSDVLWHGIRYRPGYLHGIWTVYGDVNWLRYANVIGLGHFNGVGYWERIRDLFGHRNWIWLRNLHVNVVIQGSHRYVIVRGVARIGVEGGYAAVLNNA
jgi:hypothetical protein